MTQLEHVKQIDWVQIVNEPHQMINEFNS